MEKPSTNESPQPNWFQDLQNYNRKRFIKDLLAGLTVGIIALPLSLALAIATNVPPIRGLYTASFAGFFSGILSGSPLNVSGPAAALAPIISQIIFTYKIENLPAITLLAVINLLIIAALGVGKYIRKVPESVVLGFTCGIAITIALGQTSNFMGITAEQHQELLEDRFIEVIKNSSTTQIQTIIIGTLSVIIISVFNQIKYVKKIPGSLYAVLVSSFLVRYVPFFQTVKTLEQVYGEIAMGFPPFHTEYLAFSNFKDWTLIIPSIELSVLISLESLMCSCIQDRLLPEFKHIPDKEIYCQAAGNLASIMFGGIPSTAVVARTGTMYQSGGSSRVGVIIHSLVVVTFLVLLAPIAGKIPVTCLSAVLLMTAYKISEIQTIYQFSKEQKRYVSVPIYVTMALTVKYNLVVGVATGILVDLLLFWLIGDMDIIQNLEKHLEVVELDKFDRSFTSIPSPNQKQDQDLYFPQVDYQDVEQDKSQPRNSHISQQNKNSSQQ